MQVQVNLLFDLDDVPDEIADRLTSLERKLTLSLQDIKHQLAARKVSGAMLAQKLLHAKRTLTDLDNFLQESSQIMQTYEAAVLQRESAFLKEQTELMQHAAEEGQ